MVSDPATTPEGPRAQVLVGAAVAIAYSALMTLHVVFGLFFALTLVTAGRGALIALAAFAKRRPAAPASKIPLTPVTDA